MKTSQDLMMLLLLCLCIVLPGCDDQNTNNDSFIQAQNALNQRNYHWIRDQFNPQSVDLIQQSVAHLIAAEAWLSHSNQNLAKAINHLKMAAHISPNDETIIDSILKTHIRSGNWTELELTLPHSSNQLLKAQIYLEYDPTQVPLILNQIPETDRNMIYHEIFAKYFHSQNDINNAIYHVNEAKNKGSMNPTIYYIGQQSYFQSNLNEAGEVFYKIHQDLKLLKSSQDPLIMIEAINRLRTLNPDFELNIEFLVLKIRVLLSNGDANSAELILFQINPSDLPTDFLNKILLSLIETNHFRIGSALISHSRQFNSDAETDFLICYLMSQIDNIKHALNNCNSFSKEHPWHAKLHYFVAMLLLKDNQTQAATERLQQALSYAPWNNSWRILLAQTYLSNGYFDLAVNTINQAIHDEDGLILNFKKTNGL